MHKNVLCISQASILCFVPTQCRLHPKPVICNLTFYPKLLLHTLLSSVHSLMWLDQPLQVYCTVFCFRGMERVQTPATHLFAFTVGDIFGLSS